MKHLLVIGGASLDVLHLKDRTVASLGGAGLYTAMAAWHCGARAAMFSPRPDPCPENLQPVAKLLSDWLGPAVDPGQLPQFEISYRGEETEYLKVSLGAEADLSPDMLPPDLSMYDHVHVTPLRDAAVQLSFIQVCRQRGAKRISAGTYPREVEDRPQAVRDLLAHTDCFFLNRGEAIALFGSLESASTEPGKVL
ncbi:MAG TPA: hypothetical protein VFI27_07680, partial [candidate division Zixibacteria bacterium]|nr:hypothetical protein [candidate division Zixibacteria bacterium]